ncbi:c-type cytochrome [Wohlfahrtiimonas larvae]|uniref:Cytochrome c domain-containing protein n=1 Tax=Wohlfahrtiimonas larvae TaxID=1157986 RepID=A0ABP9MSU6_9GAMM|nr:c-type cytochrome [Wohlfahrtiimonas larvae]
MKKHIILSLSITALMVTSAFAYTLTASQPKEYEMISKDGQPLPDYVVPSDLAIANEPNADEIFYGKELLNSTKRLLPDNVGAMMNCNSCHIAEGKSEFGAPYLTSLPQYPKVMPRAGKLVNMEMRINGCFQRSMNGKPLNPESKEMKAMIAYMEWLSKTQPEGAKVKLVNSGPVDESLVPNVDNGKIIYAERCASCHGNDGEGLKDKRGNIIFPPLWGDESFNIGAGLARTYKAAQFVKYNMPMGVETTGIWGQGNQGTLTDQEAVDVSEYFTHMPRPDFPGKVNDWPNGNKPKDARY